MGNFCDEHNIKVICDGIGNTIWEYKGVEIAYYMDLEEPEGHIYVANHWFVNKRNCNLRIEPLYKIHGKVLSKKVDDPHSMEFQMAVLDAMLLLDKRLQILKGKITMLEKHRTSNYSNCRAIENLTEKQFNYIKNNIGKTITLCNKNVLNIIDMKKCVSESYHISSLKLNNVEMYIFSDDVYEYYFTRTFVENRWWNANVIRV